MWGRTMWQLLGDGFSTWLLLQKSQVIAIMSTQMDIFWLKYLNIYFRHYAVNACLVPVVTMHGRAVTTVEGIGSVQKGLHTVQVHYFEEGSLKHAIILYLWIYRTRNAWLRVMEFLAKGHGIQCGFCTPGFVMSMYVLLRNNSQPTKVEIQTAIEGLHTVTL